MSATDSTRHRGESHFGRLARKRWVPFAAAATAAVLTAGAIASAGGGAAGAATLPQAQSVGNFLDATLGGSTLDGVAALKYATAKSPGTESVQNPLDVTALSAIHLPLTGALQFPKLVGADLGAVNQVAVAHHDGSSYGAAGAVSNSGGVSIGGDNNAFPDVASIDLCASALTGGVCNSGPLDSLGELKLGLGAVSAVASTPKGYGKAGATKYDIASLNLSLGSPVLGGLLGTVTTTLGGVVSQLTTALSPILAILGAQFPASCTLVSGQLPTTINLPSDSDKAVSIDVATATITVHLDTLLDDGLHLPLNQLPPNTDLVKYLVSHLSDILTNGLGGIVTGLINTLQTTIGSCVSALGPLAGLITDLFSALNGVVTTVTTTLGQVLKPITDAIAPLLNVLTSIIDIGVNVQPNGPAGTYTSPLAATPKQDTPVVAKQTIERAIEIDLLNGAGSLPIGSLPIGNLTANAKQAKVLGVKPAAKKAAATDPGALISLALANAAAGPSAAPAATTPPATSTPPGSTAPPTSVPTGVPAGMGTHHGTPALTWVLLLLGLTFAGGGVAAYRMRGRLNLH